MNVVRLAAPCAAFGLAALLLLPAHEARAFSLLGGSLNLDQRDYRIFNNFADTEANDNTNPHPQFPGYDGAEMSIWKAFLEWGSLPHGDGTGDPLQVQIGDGGANFDPAWNAAATGVGGTNDNIVSTTSSCSGGVLAFAETPISNGWRIRFCENIRWSDGPGAPPFNAFDMQGVGTHEFGHALGLGHSTFSAVMQPATQNGLSGRDLKPDDIAGIQALYGVASANKPQITSVTVDVPTQTATIVGTNFSSTGNEVWFTPENATSTGADPRVRLLNVPASGGTTIVVTIPAAAGNGDVLVKRVGTDNDDLSNAFPLNAEGVALPLGITSLSPSSVDVLVPGTSQFLRINGSGFSARTFVNYNFVSVDSSRVTVVSDSLITVDLPQAPLGVRSITVQEGFTADSADLTVVAPAVPKLQVASGDPLARVSVSGPDLPIVIGGRVGQSTFVFASLSNVPSVAPGLVSLDIGNGFSDVTLLVNGTIPGSGFTQFSIPVNPTIPTGLTIYMQSVVLGAGRPFPVSDPGSPQSIQTVP